MNKCKIVLTEKSVESQLANDYVSFILSRQSSFIDDVLATILLYYDARPSELSVEIVNSSTLATTMISFVVGVTVYRIKYLGDLLFEFRSDSFVPVVDPVTHKLFVEDSTWIDTTSDNQLVTVQFVSSCFDIVLVEYVKSRAIKILPMSVLSPTSPVVDSSPVNPELSST